MADGQAWAIAHQALQAAAGTLGLTIPLQLPGMVPVVAAPQQLPGVVPLVAAPLGTHVAAPQMPGMVPAVAALQQLPGVFPLDAGLQLPGVVPLVVAPFGVHAAVLAAVVQVKAGAARVLDWLTQIQSLVYRPLRRLFILVMSQRRYWRPFRRATP
jgi:hypothetical protein